MTTFNSLFHSFHFPDKAESPVGSGHRLVTEHEGVIKDGVHDQDTGEQLIIFKLKIFESLKNFKKFNP